MGEYVVRKYVWTCSLIVIAIVWLVFTGYPLVFLVQGSLKERFFESGIWELPKHFAFSNYAKIFASGRLYRYFINSIMIVFISVFLIILLSSMASYIFTRIQFPWKRFLFILFVSGLMIPIHSTLIPVYIFTNKIGIYDTIWALIGPYVAWNLPLSIFILTAFMQGLPKELDDAAAIDGCSPIGVYWRIILPLCKPAIAALTILNFIFCWNEFLYALVLVSSPESRTVPLGIYVYQGQFWGNISLVMTVVMVGVLPMLVVYAFLKKQIIRGMTFSGLKG